MKVHIGPYPGIRSEKERKVNVVIHPYDTWNMDSTLSLIIVPMLKQLKETKHGSPHVDDDDVPEHLRSTSAPPKENVWDTDENHHLRWDWVLDEMIWAFEQINSDWEDQFHTGEISFDFVEDPTTADLPDGPYSIMVKKDDHTHKFDRAGYNAYAERIRRGTTLFGKHYQSLWD